jgi:hypothetical protein
MLSCKDVTEKASDYLDKEMSLMQKLQFKLHLFMCHSCRRFVKQFKVTIGTVGRLEPEQVSDEAIDKQVKTIMKKTKD